MEMALRPEDACPIATHVHALGSNFESEEPDLQILKIGARYLNKIDTLKRKNKQEKTQATVQKIKGGKGFFMENIKANEKSKEKVKDLKEKIKNVQMTGKSKTKIKLETQMTNQGKYLYFLQIQKEKALYSRL